ncbi:Flp pilus assembly protein CpaB [Actinomadura atramentaria]|uniref:Flp pilus assembly protein CpaB n=1 Tax=Actinomadura atramentaria TaxID=1990 RepID=UPI0003733D4D|nr:Flp pilus assembly protein CpaB [Actinomadura atramentaria]
MNPRQRRGVLLMAAAAAGAVLVFVTVLGYVGRVRSDADAAVGQMTTVLQAGADVAAFDPVTSAPLRQVRIPKKWSTGAFVTNVAELQGKVAAGAIPAGAYLQRGMFLDEPSLRPGQREIAIMIDAETGVAGKVRNGSIVDVYASFDSTQNGDRTTSACAVRVLNRVQVINAGEVQQGSRGDGKSAAQGASEVMPVTFALNSDDVLKLTYAESFARKVRLALVGGSQDAKPPFNKLCETPQAGR